ncbi:hypothetical protein Glove_25g44 [Diversispora epigaea]|uniref:Galactose oxidase n=1 Tax=Diversispora epigaea TaxID=1348612 RepID=A0A397JUX8_9GLOM|nr:hypothetical protein Glove_25g44 [Diversispora epigaea]
MNSLLFIFTSVFLQSLIVVALFNPGDRCFHETVHIGDKLFFLGGYNNDNHLCDFFYLDLSISFHKDFPPWYNLNFRRIPFGVSKAASIFGGSDNATIFLIGGERSDSGSDYIYSFNTKSFIWRSYPLYKSFEWLWNMKGVTDDKGRAYFYGGWSSNSRISSDKLQIFESNILEPLKITWFESSSRYRESSSRYGHTVTLLSNGIIVIIGGYVDDKSGIDKILLYDTNKKNWTSMITQGISLSERAHHTAALSKFEFLTNDGRIIVYGGIKKESFDPNLVVLDTNFQPFKWLTPTPEVNHPPLYGLYGLYGHSANIVGDYMILEFGKFKIFDEEIYNRHTYLMDIRNYTWVSYFHPKRNVDTTTQVITTKVVTTTHVITTQVVTETQVVTTTQAMTTQVTETQVVTTTRVIPTTRVISTTQVITEQFPDYNSDWQSIGNSFRQKISADFPATFQPKICIQILVELDIVALFNPGDRCFHETVHIGDKLFFLGGYNDNDNHLSDFFYLDLSISFHKDIPPWYNLDFREIPFGVSKAASSFGGSDNATIFLIGGERNDSISSYIYSFNTKSFIWTSHSLNKSTFEWLWTFEWLLDMKGVTGDKGRTYFYGGRSSNSHASSNKLQILEFNILEPLKITWFESSSRYRESSSRYGHTVTLLSNGIIVIIGGYVNDKSGIDEILLYNTNKSNWTSMITQGISLSERARHTAALTNDGRIIVYGGIKKDSLDPNLVVLDTNFQPFKWLTPEVNHPPLYGLYGLYGHSANIVGDYMILAFGKFKIFDEEIYNRHTYLIDVRNYTWVSYFHPKRNVDMTTQVITTQVVTTTHVITTQVKTTKQATKTQVATIKKQVPVYTVLQLIQDISIIGLFTLLCYLFFRL